MPRSRKVVELEDRLEALQLEKAAYLSKVRSEARSISAKLSKTIADERAKVQVEGMSPEDKEALAGALVGESN